jgi:uncharacterized protein
MKRLVIIGLLLAVFFINSFYLGMIIGTDAEPIYIYSGDPFIYGDMNRSSFASIHVPAVDENEQGVVTLLTVQAINEMGSGKILVNIDRIFFWGDTQDSIRTARNVAQETRNLDLSNVDLVYTITANASVIEGPSAGAAIAIATVFAVEDREVNSSIMITGTIENDGSIRQVGGILAKANASRDQGAQVLLVPPGQTIERIENLDCEWIGWIEDCKIVYETVNVAQQSGIRVIEVNNINEALNYFLA